MKAVHTAEYFEQYKTLLFEKYRKDCDFEGSLKQEMIFNDFSALPEEVREKAEMACTQISAKKVYENGRANLTKTMRTIKEVEAGRASLGYTTMRQEISAMHDLVEGFEFSCYMLAEFRKKYNL